MARTYRKKIYKQKDKETKVRKKLSNRKERKNNKTKKIMDQYEDERIEQKQNKPKGQV